MTTTTLLFTSAHPHIQSPSAYPHIRTSAHPKPIRISAHPHIRTSKTHPHIRTSAHQKVFLTGMPGAGKTYWAEKLKDKLPFYELDDLVEEMEEKTITEIFEKDGEEYFRKAEARMLRLFAEKKAFILSCGGGTPCFHGNMQWMNEQGVTIWLNVSVDILFKRLQKEKAHRPLIKNMSDDELRSYLHTTLKQREPFYKQATYTFADAELKEDNFHKILKAHA